MAQILGTCCRGPCLPGYCSCSLHPYNWGYLYQWRRGLKKICQRMSKLFICTNKTEYNLCEECQSEKENMSFWLKNLIKYHNIITYHFGYKDKWINVNSKEGIFYILVLSPDLPLPAPGSSPILMKSGIKKNNLKERNIPRYSGRKTLYHNSGLLFIRHCCTVHSPYSFSVCFPSDLGSWMPPVSRPVCSPWWVSLIENS